MSEEGYTIKDSGEKIQFASGMVRDAAQDKVDYLLALDGPMFRRWAEHLHRACTGPNPKYPARNWMKATGQAELDRFRVSAFRHMLDWLAGKTDEDHAAAVMFNLNGYEYVKAQMQLRVVTIPDPVLEGRMTAREFIARQDDEGQRQKKREQIISAQMKEDK
jgi:dATP/dGTP diphosphohydrolase